MPCLLGPGEFQEFSPSFTQLTFQSVNYAPGWCISPPFLPQTICGLLMQPARQPAAPNVATTHHSHSHFHSHSHLPQLWHWLLLPRGTQIKRHLMSRLQDERGRRRPCGRGMWPLGKGHGRAPNICLPSKLAMRLVRAARMRKMQTCGCHKNVKQPKKEHVKRGQHVVRT